MNTINLQLLSHRPKSKKEPSRRKGIKFRFLSIKSNIKRRKKMKTVARDRRAKTQDEKMRIAFISFSLMLVFLFFSPDSFAKDKLEKELLIKVKSNIIALPGNSVSIVPINAARVRSTELRELNKELHAVKIERLYQLNTTLEQDSMKIKGLRSEGKAKDPKPEVDLAKIFTNDIRKKEVKEGRKVNQVADTYIIHFDFDAEVNMNLIAERYMALDAVTYAQHIVRTE